MKIESSFFIGGHCLTLGVGAAPPCVRPLEPVTEYSCECWFYDDDDDDDSGGGGGDKYY